MFSIMHYFTQGIDNPKNYTKESDFYFDCIQTKLFSKLTNYFIKPSDLALDRKALYYITA